MSEGSAIKKASAVHDHQRTGQSDGGLKLPTDNFDLLNLYKQYRFVESVAAVISDSMAPEKETRVIADESMLPAAYEGARFVGCFMQKSMGINIIDKHPKTPRNIVDDLLTQSNQHQKLLGDVVIVTHGSPDGDIYLKDTRFPLNSSEVLDEFARLKGHIMAGSRITFVGCETGAGESAPSILQHVADFTGVSVRAYKWYQSSFIPEGFGPNVEKSPDPKAPSYDVWKRQHSVVSCLPYKNGSTGRTPMLAPECNDAPQLSPGPSHRLRRAK